MSATPRRAISHTRPWSRDSTRPSTEWPMTEVPTTTESSTGSRSHHRLAFSGVGSCRGRHRGRHLGERLPGGGRSHHRRRPGRGRHRTISDQCQYTLARAGHVERSHRRESGRVAGVSRGRLARRLSGRPAVRPLPRLRREDRPARGHGRLRRGQLLSRQPGDASADGRLPPEGEARSGLRPAAVYRGLLRRRPARPPSPTGSNSSRPRESRAAAGEVTIVRVRPSRGSRWRCFC